MTRFNKPLKNELPSEYADRLGLQYTSMVTATHKKDLGQFFTPLDVSNFMADFSVSRKGKVKILDPGCGIGILTCSLTENLIRNIQTLNEIEIVAFESDSQLLHYTDACLNYLSEWVLKQKIKFTYFLCKNDFILHNSIALENTTVSDELYDIVIANPPYFKIRKEDPRAVAAKSVIYGQTNIYTIFLLIAAKLLSHNGQLIFITPRSFSSGSYFRAFREKFFSIVNISDIHLFESRKETFERDKILQENIIVTAIKKVSKKQISIAFDNSPFETLKISTSKGINDVASKKIKQYKFDDLVDMNSFQKILHIPISKNDDKAIKIFKSWRGSLHSYGIEISTGPVVDFRNIKFITQTEKRQSVPLIYLHNIDKMQFTWPINKLNKGKQKGHYITYNKESESRLIANKDYILLRRFSSKDDRSRLIASPYFSSWLENYSMIGIENHLNYIYRPNGNLEQKEVYGFAAIFNSRLFDIYFRTFNGNINVSATELREMPLPKLVDIMEIGDKIISSNQFTQEKIDLIIQKKFKIDLG